MNATIPMLLVSTVATAFAPQSGAQETNQPRASSRRPVDVSIEGLGEATRRAPGDTPRGSIGFSARRPTGSLTPIDCTQSVADQADPGGCLMASSTPSLGMLYPYPGRDNMVTGPLATAGGGTLNTASGRYATVGGGIGNTASNFHSTVGGGWYNTANDVMATVAGGGNNDALGQGATVAGGRFNTAGWFSAVAGGSFNTASGAYASVSGGQTNGASGRFSFAGGRNAKTNHDGAFVWGDSYYNFQKPSLKTSSAVDEFNVYASGGVRMFTNRAATTGVLLAAGGSTWTMVSDRDAKENVEPVDAQAVLDKVSQLPLSTWNYKAQDDSIRHMGPMAQDFYAAFGLGLGEKTIDTMDPNGVALAAIQGLTAELEERLAEKDAEIKELRTANEALVARVERLEELARR